MNTYDFEVIIGNKKCGGSISIIGNNEDDATQKALDYLADKLYNALPELDIEFSVELIEDSCKKVNDPALTKEEAVRRHRELWNKIAEMIKENGGAAYGWDSEEIKQEALNELGYNEIINNRCWCCEYEKQNRLNGCICKNCPIKWHGHFCYNSEYKDFCCALDDRLNKEAYRMAKVIANLPEAE